MKTNLCITLIKGDKKSRNMIRTLDKKIVKSKFIFKAPAFNMEFVEDGVKTEIKPMHLPKHDKLEKEPKF